MFIYLFLKTHSSLSVTHFSKHCIPFFIWSIEKVSDWLLIQMHWSNLKCDIGCKMVTFQCLFQLWEQPQVCWCQIGVVCQGMQQVNFRCLTICFIDCNAASCCQDTKQFSFQALFCRCSSYLQGLIVSIIIDYQLTCKHLALVISNIDLRLTQA